MGSPYLNSDESIILISQHVIIKSVPFEAILTDKRLILVDSTNALFQSQTIPFATITIVMAGENAIGDPIITLSLTAPDTTEQMVLAFSRRPRGQRNTECDEWVKKLKEHISSSRQEASRTGVPLPDHEREIRSRVTPPPRIDRARPFTTTVETRPAPQKPKITPPQPETPAAAVGEAEPADTPPPALPLAEVPLALPAADATQKAPSSPPQPPVPASPPGRQKFITVTAIIILILAIVVGAYIYSPFLQGKPGPSSVPAAIPTITAAETTLPAPAIQQTPTPQVTPMPSLPPQVIIPATGVWVRVNYPGNFAGRVGTPGTMRPVTGAGDHFYQIPTMNGTVEVSIQKQDGSGNMLAIEVYKNGAMIKRRTTTAPMGTIELLTDVKTGNPPGITPAVTP